MIIAEFEPNFYAPLYHSGAFVWGNFSLAQTAYKS